MRIKSDYIFYYLISLFLIVDGYTMWCALTSTVLTGAATKVIIYSLCLLYIVKHRAIPYQGLQVSIFLLIYLTIYIIGARQGIDRSISFITQILIPFVIYPVFCSIVIRNNDLGKLLKAFSDIMLFLGIVSLFCWTFGTVLDVIPFRRQVTYIWAGGVRRTAYTYFNLYYETNLQTVATQLLNLSGLNRNVGIFCESPGYAMFLDLALAIELLANKKINKKRVAIIVITAITTFSTTAYVFIVLAFALRFAIITKSNNRYKLMLLYSLIPIVMVVCIGIVNVLIKDKIGDAAKSIRLDDWRAGLMALRSHPIFGCGFYDNNAILEYAALKRGNSGLSMGSSFMARGGLYFMLLYFGSLVAAFSCRAFKPYKKELVVFSILILYHFLLGGVGEQQISILMISIPYTYYMMNYQSKSVEILNEYGSCRKMST